MGLRGTSLIRQNEASTDPDGGSAEHESSGNRVTVEKTAGSNDLDGLAGQRALLALDQLGNRGNKNGGWDITSVTTTLTTLGADNIDTNIEALLNVLGVTDHVHGEDTGAVELLDDGLGRNTDGRDEKAGALRDDDIDKLSELTLGVVVAMRNKGQTVSDAFMAGKKKDHDQVRFSDYLTWSCERCRQPEEGAGRHRKVPSCQSRSS